MQFLVVLCCHNIPLRNFNNRSGGVTSRSWSHAHKGMIKDRKFILLSYKMHFLNNSLKKERKDLRMSKLNVVIAKRAWGGFLLVDHWMLFSWQIFLHVDLCHFSLITPWDKKPQNQHNHNSSMWVLSVRYAVSSKWIRRGALCCDVMGQFFISKAPSEHVKPIRIRRRWAIND